MSASLVGSEMCIRDRGQSGGGAPPSPPSPATRSPPDCGPGWPGREHRAAWRWRRRGLPTAADRARRAPGRHR
eukprot:10785730-Alexandrium_andersonii.AAC.1